MSRIMKKGHYVASPNRSHSPHTARSIKSDDESPRIHQVYGILPHTLDRDGRENLKHDSRENGYHYIPASYRYPKENGYDTGSEIYVTSGAYKSPSEKRYHPPSEYSPPSRRAPSAISLGGRSYQRAGLKIDAAMTTNPFCPNTKGLCCLMLLFNLGIILVTLGFVIVIQFHDPIIVWILGIIFLVFGCLTLIGSLIYCVVIFRDVEPPRDDIYWTHHWQKRIGTTPSEGFSETHDDYPHDVVSDKYMDQLSDKYYNKKNSRY